MGAFSAGDGADQLVCERRATIGLEIGNVPVIIKNELLTPLLSRTQI